MKKITKIGLISIAIVVVAVCAWFIGYHTRKSQDNLPSLESIAKMDEAEVNELLVGYRNYQLEDVWGEPDVESENTWIWEIDEHTQLQVSCNNKDKVVVCSIDAVFQAKILEIFDGSYLVEPVEGSPELRSSDRITVSIKHLDSSLEPEVGDIIEIIHSGEIMESHPARLQDIYSICVVTEQEAEKWDLIPMVMGDGTQKPTQDGASNFGTGYGYQYGPQEGTIEIFMNEKWWVFAKEEVRQKIQFPTETTD